MKRAPGHRRSQVPYCVFTDPPLAHVGLSEREAQRQGVAARVARLPMNGVLRTATTDETQGFMKALVGGSDDRILGFTMIGAEAGEVMTVVQTAMLADLPYPRLRDAVIAHPTMAEGLGPLFSNVPAPPAQSARRRGITMTSKLAGKVALVTGGSAGIGLGIAKRFVQEGARVFITGRRQSQLDEAVVSIGGDAAAIRGDTSNLADLDLLFAEIRAQAGRIDVLAVALSRQPYRARIESQDSPRVTPLRRHLAEIYT